jgi:hypothetical protein
MLILRFVLFFIGFTYLGWYLQEYTSASKASEYLIEQKKGRLVDYERVAFAYQKKDPALAAKISKEAYLKFKHPYLFYSYANGALNSGNYDELRGVIESIDAGDSPLKEESLFWVIKAKVYQYYNQESLEQEALLKAYDLAPDNMQIKLELLWFYIDAQDTANVKKILSDMQEEDNLSSSLYLPMASGYFFLSDINRASFYTQKLLESKDSAVDTIEFKFLQAYIYQIQNNEYSFSSYMHDIVRELEKKSAKNQELKKDDKYLSSYLRAAMYVLAPDEFEEKLQAAKPYLKTKNYDEISYSWAMKNHAYEKSRMIYHRMNKKDLWVEFSDALVAQDHSRIENLLVAYLYSLSAGDASQALQKDGQVALSQAVTYEILDKNSKNQNAYIHHMNLSKERSDLLEAKTAYYNRDPLLQNYIQVDNKIYLQDAYYLLSRFDYYANKSLDDEILINVPKSTIVGGLGLKRVYNRGSLEALVSYHSSMDDYIELSLGGEYRLSTDLKVGAKVGNNMDALETTQLLLGGKKDIIATTLAWQILDSTAIDFLYQYNDYSSQDDVALGDGQYARVSVSYQIRNGYPDLRIGSFYDMGMYNETEGSRGVIDELSIYDYQVLPNNFYNIGVNFAYGMVNSNIYTRVWRPYVEFFPYYNSDLGDVTFGAIVGYGGKVYHQDHLSIGASYTDSVNGVGGTIFEIFLKYQFMYYHP